MPESVIANLVIVNDGPKSFRSRNDRTCWSLKLVVNGTQYPIMEVETKTNEYCIEDAIAQVAERLKAALATHA